MYILKDDLDGVDKDVIEGFRVGRDNLHISHLQFADDMILSFCSSREVLFINLNQILSNFEFISG